MDKDAILKELRAAVGRGEITLDEIDSAVGRVSVQKTSRMSGFQFSHLLYYIGGGISFLGISIYVGQNWDDFSSVLRILLTLGAGFLFFVSAVLLDVSQKVNRVPDAFHFIAGFMIPGGVFVTLNELGYHGGSWGPGLIFLGLTCAYAIAYYIYRHNLLLAFTVAYATSAFLLLTDAIVDEKPIFDFDDYAAYRVFAIGVAYLFLGYAFRESERKVLSGWLYGFGTAGLLAASFALQGWNPNQSVFWEIMFPGLVFGVMFLSLILKSKPMLFIGAFALIGDIFKITEEYFRDSLSWPLFLALAGFILIGVGYVVYFLNKKYLKSEVSI